MIKNRKAKKQEVFTGTAKVIAGVVKLMLNSSINITGNVVFLFPELWYNNKAAAAWMKNLYLYCRLVNGHREGMALYFKNIETGELMGFFQDGKATVSA